jgi:hypothetical protein
VNELILLRRFSPVAPGIAGEMPEYPTPSTSSGTPMFPTFEKSFLSRKTLRARPNDRVPCSAAQAGDDVALMHAPHIAPSSIEPRENEDLIPRSYALKTVKLCRLEYQPDVGCSFMALLGTDAMSVKGLDFPDQDHAGRDEPGRSDAHQGIVGVRVTDRGVDDRGHQRRQRALSDERVTDPQAPDCAKTSANIAAP